MKNSDNEVKNDMQPSAVPYPSNNTANHNCRLLGIGKPTKVIAVVSAPPPLDLENCADEARSIFDIFHHQPHHEGDM